MHKNDTDPDRKMPIDASGSERDRKVTAGQPNSASRQREPGDERDNPDKTIGAENDDDDEIDAADAEGFGQQAGQAEGQDRGQARQGQGGGHQKQGDQNRGVGDSGNRQGQREGSNQDNRGNKEDTNRPQQQPTGPTTRDNDKGDQRPNR